MICPLCGTNYDGDRCPVCGTIRASADDPKNNGNKKLIIVIAASIVGLLIFLTCIGIFSYWATSNLIEAGKTMSSATNSTPPSSHEVAPPSSHNDNDKPTPPAQDPLQKLNDEMVAFSYTYNSGADEKYITTAEPLPHGGYLITKDSEHLMSPIEMQITDDDYTKISDLFDTYEILSTDSTAKDADEEYALYLTAQSADGNTGRYLFATQDFYNQQITDFHDELEQLFDSFGEWTFTRDLYDVPPVTEFLLIKQDGNEADVFNLANHLDDYSISEEVIANEKVTVDANHMQYRKYQNGTSGIYSLTPLTKPDMMELASIAAKYHIGTQEKSESGEYIAGGNVPADHFYFTIQIQQEGEDPFILSFGNKNDVPPECLRFYEEIAETYLLFED